MPRLRDYVPRATGYGLPGAGGWGLVLGRWSLVDHGGFQNGSGATACYSLFFRHHKCHHHNIYSILYTTRHHHRVGSQLCCGVGFRFEGKAPR
eukprot:9488259-Pyramimonas_sp.AAC.1